MKDRQPLDDSPAPTAPNELRSQFSINPRAIAHGLCATIASIIIVGYWLDIPALTNLILPIYGPHYLSAFAIVLLSFGRMCLEIKRPLPVRAIAVGAFLLGLYALGEFLFSAPDPKNVEALPDQLTGHVSPHAALGFAAAAMGLMFSRACPGVVVLVWGILLNVMVFLIGMLILAGHLFQVRVALAWGSADAVSPITGTWFILYSWLTARMIWESCDSFDIDSSERWRQFVLVAVGGAALTTLISAVFSVLPLYGLLETTRVKTLQLELDNRASKFDAWVANAKLLGQSISSRPSWEVLRATREGRVSIDEYRIVAGAKTAEVLKNHPEVASLQRYHVDEGNVDLSPLYTWGLPLHPALPKWNTNTASVVLEPLRHGNLQLLPILTPIQGAQNEVIGWDVMSIYSKQLRELFDALPSEHKELDGELIVLLPTESGNFKGFRFNRRTDSIRQTRIRPAVIEALRTHFKVKLNTGTTLDAEPGIDRMVSLVSPAKELQGYVSYQISYRNLHRQENAQLLKFFLSVMLVALFGSAGVYFAVQHLLHRTSVLQLQVDENIRLLNAADVERKKITGELDASRQEASALFSNSPLGIAVADSLGNIVSANPEFLALIHHTAESIRTESLWEIFPTLPDSLPDIATFNEPTRGEFRAITGDRSEFTAEVRCIPLRTPVFSGFALYVDNIEDRKRDEGIIQQSLKEKELLLKEIHHRVKNNLQVISSLLALQSRTLSAPAAQVALHDSQQRVKSIALLHDLLYRSHDLAHIPFGIYLDRLLNRLVQSMALTGTIDIDLEASKNAALNLDQAIPCGLIVNEIVTNSLKHAFAPGGQGRITVRFVIDSGVCRCTISDDGKGVAEPTKLERSQALGVRLVRTLIQQLGGEYSVESQNGLTWTFHFPVQLESDHNHQQEAQAV